MGAPKKNKFWHRGNRDGTNGVGLLVKHELAVRVLEIEGFSNRLRKIRMVLGKTICHIFSAYASLAGLTAEEKENSGSLWKMN